MEGRRELVPLLSKKDDYDSDSEYAPEYISPNSIEMRYAWKAFVYVPTHAKFLRKVPAFAKYFNADMTNWPLVIKTAEIYFGLKVSETAFRARHIISNFIL